MLLWVSHMLSHNNLRLVFSELCEHKDFYLIVWFLRYSPEPQAHRQGLKFHKSQSGSDTMWRSGGAESHQPSDTVTLHRLPHKRLHFHFGNPHQSFKGIWISKWIAGIYRQLKQNNCDYSSSDKGCWNAICMTKISHSNDESGGK